MKQFFEHFPYLPAYVVSPSDILVSPSSQLFKVIRFHFNSKIPNDMNMQTFRCIVQPRIEIERIQMNAFPQTTRVHPEVLYTSPSPRDRQKSRMPSSA